VRDRVRQHNLPMKVSDAEWQWDKRKLTIYFTAEQRVDFRALVRDLAGLFRTRIELRQIGARDEAKRLDGIGRCGRQLCISSWLPEGKPVSLSLAKAQGLSLNPVQISGPCGRLLCCLHYEHDFYVQQRKRFPKEGKTVKTSVGNERVISVDIFRERVTLRSEAGETRVVALDQLLL
jgi:cell fate regulator YaaT (PSP1 superfamily)